MVKKARAAGSFLGGIANNPGVIIILLVLGGLFIFRNRISEAFAAIPGAVAGGIGDINIQLPSIEFPDIEFPDFKFPDFKFPDIFNFFNQEPKDISEEEFELNGAPGMFGEGTTFDPGTGIIEGDTPPTVDLGLEPGGLDPLGEISFNRLKSGVFNTLTQTIGLTPGAAFAQLRDIDFDMGAGFAALDQVLQSFNEPLPQQAPPLEAISGFDDQFIGAFSESGGFVGGGIFQTPIQNLSLSQIIDMFNVTASQAANIKAIAADDFGDFDFGTNTGLGIGSVLSSIPGLSGLGGNVSDPQFQGLSAQEIADFLTGGNISNF